MEQGAVKVGARLQGAWPGGEQPEGVQASGRWAPTSVTAHGMGKTAYWQSQHVDLRASCCLSAFKHNWNVCSFLALCPTGESLCAGLRERHCPEQLAVFVLPLRGKQVQLKVVMFS